MATSGIGSILAGAKKALASAGKFTQSVEGSPASSFAPKKIPAPKAPQAHEYSNAPYALAHELKAKQQNVEQYMAAEPK